MLDLLSNWDAVAAVDHHCHPLRHWSPELAALELRAVFTEAGNPRLAREHVSSSVAYRWALKVLGAALGCEASEAAVLGARAGSGLRGMMRLARTRLLLLDHGFGDARTLAREDHDQAVGIASREVVRLETLAEARVLAFTGWEDWLDGVIEDLGREVAAGAVAVKTIVAYRAGLRLRMPSDVELGEAFAELRAAALAGQTIRLAGSALCHPLVFRAAAACLRLEVPMQVHCGFGDPELDLAEASPLGLRPLLTGGYEGLRLVLLHCYPFHREAAHLCSVHPDVHMDLSLAIPLAGLDGERALTEALGLCPCSKLLYATDASRLPELYVVASTLQRQALAAALDGLVDRGAMDVDEAVEAGRQVLAGNAERLYRL